MIAKGFFMFDIAIYRTGMYISNTQIKEVIMKISKIFGKAMIDNDIPDVLALSKLAGISYERTMRLMKDQSSAKFIDVIAIAECLDLDLKFVRREGV